MLERLNQADQTPNPRHWHLPQRGERRCDSFEALAVEIHEDWIEAHRYLNMEMRRPFQDIKDQRRSWVDLNLAACARPSRICEVERLPEP